ncbi:hypothetical protein EV424DRAFT_1536589 [Suillus variegatus]|nr:hypothetical protein EV424DRAFT_1536589 [Suillus variegatus]
MEEAIRAKEAQDRAEARQPRGPSVLKTTRPLKTTKSMTQNHIRDTAAMNQDDDASLKDTANGNCATKSQKDSRKENVRLTKHIFNDSEKGNDSEFDDVDQLQTAGPQIHAHQYIFTNSGRNTSVNPFSGLDDHPDLPDVPPDVEITKAQKPIISVGRVNLFQTVALSQMEQKSSSQRAPTCGVSPQEWPATSGADRTSSQSLSESKTQGTARRTVPLSLFRFAVPLDSSDDDAPSSTHSKNRFNSDSKFRSDVDMDTPMSAQPSKRSKVNPEPSSNHDMDHNIEGPSNIEGPNDINDNPSDVDDNASDQSDTLVKENRDVRMDDGEDCDLRRKDRNNRKTMEHKIQLKPNSSRQHSVQSLKRYAFKTRIQISQEKLSANSAQSKGMMALAIAKTSSTANTKSKQKSSMRCGLATCEADDDATDRDNDTDFDGSGSTAHVQGKMHHRKRQPSQKFWNEDLPPGTIRHFRAVFMPMWFELVARFEEPWDIADRKKNDPVFFLVKQCTYNWCSMFTTRGEKAMTAFISWQATGFDTPVEIEAYVEWAVPQTQAFHDDEGRGNSPPPIFPFMWANVDESDSENPIGKGPFQHETILNTFAFYLESIAAIPDGLQKTSSPKAALALATVAVERAWKQWATGELVQDSFNDKFLSAMWNLPTQEILESIDKLKPRTWTKILEGAAHFIGAHKPKLLRWISEVQDFLASSDEVDVLLYHLIENRAAGVAAINADQAIQTIGPLKTGKMVKTKWTSLKKMFNQIEIYRGVSGFHWDNVRGAGIEGVAAANVWDAYVAPKSRIAMCHFRNKGWPLYNDMQAILGENSGARGRHSFHPATAAPTSIAVDDVLDGPDGALDLLNMDVGGSVSGTTPGDSQSSKRLCTNTLPDSLETALYNSGDMSCHPNSHESPSLPLSATLVVPSSQVPAFKKARVLTHASSTHTGVSSAAKIAAKITPAAAVMNMQGSINHLTDAIEKNMAPLPDPPAPPPAPVVPTLISRGLAIMRSVDGDLSVD